MLFPQESLTREQKDLDGIWQFKPDWDGTGLNQAWYREPLTDTMLMPVPASYNEMTQDVRLRDHVGDVWYERRFRVSRAWQDKRVVLRFGSVSHHATVWVNGELVMEHHGGFLPFEAEVTSHISFAAENRLTVKVDNRLDWTTLPPGEVVEVDEFNQPLGRQKQKYFHDFYNYAGIHRPVILYSTPRTYVYDVAVRTDIDGSTGLVHYSVCIAGGSSADGGVHETGEQGGAAQVKLHLLDVDGGEVAAGEGLAGTLQVPDAHFWAPGAPYLYSLVVHVVHPSGTVLDEYSLRVGIRTVQVSGKQFLINGKPFYFRGFGKHEDSDIRGKGLDTVMNIKDFNLLAWTGANSFRTSHYPYADEIMDLADELGYVVIDEIPAVGFNLWDKNEAVFSPERAGNPHLLENHLTQLRELVQRDRNHPCVVMWNVANEAATYEEAALPYFTRVAEFTRELDDSRPISIVENCLPQESLVSHLFDVICINRYLGWYTDAGDLDIVETQLERELRGWDERFGKPILMTEYGADAVAGLHQNPPVIFTEEYQCEFLTHYHHVFDRLDFIIGEHVWNFADFATKQGITRIIGNRKGVFTRQRQPKAAAHLLRARWTQGDN